MKIHLTELVSPLLYSYGLLQGPGQGDPRGPWGGLGAGPPLFLLVARGGWGERGGGGRWYLIFREK